MVTLPSTTVEKPETLIEIEQSITHMPNTRNRLTRVKPDKALTDGSRRTRRLLVLGRKRTRHRRLRGRWPPDGGVLGRASANSATSPRARRRRPRVSAAAARAIASSRPLVVAAAARAIASARPLVVAAAAASTAPYVVPVPSAAASTTPAIAFSFVVPVPSSSAAVLVSASAGVAAASVLPPVSAAASAPSSSAASTAPPAAAAASATALVLHRRCGCNGMINRQDLISAESFC